MGYRIECYSPETGWLLYGYEQDMEKARMKAANAFINTRHTMIKIVEGKL